MTKISLPHFAEFNSIKLEEYYSTEIPFNGKTLHLDLNFENNSIDEEEVKTIQAFLDNIAVYDQQNKVLISKDFKEDGETADYINFYLDELDEAEQGNIIDLSNDAKSKNEQLLDKLNLIRIGLYPDGKYGTDYYGVFDYSIEIDGEPCNQLLVIKTDKNGNLDHITWES